MMEGNSVPFAGDPVTPIQTQGENENCELERDLDQLAQLLVDIYLWRVEEERRRHTEAG